MTNRNEELTNSESELLSRRHWLRATVATGAGIGIAGIGLSRLAVAHDDDHGEDDNDRDDDNSGPGNGDDHDDHSGRDHDEDDDRDDDVPANSSPVAGVTTVEIRDEAFVPAHIIIDPGQTVTWNNLDDDEHTATGATFDTGVLDRGESGQVRFDTPGVYAYVCQFHAHMQGSVTVRGAVATPVASPQASSAGTGETTAVSIIDFAFDPVTVTIPTGTKIVWTNSGQAPHTMTGSFFSSDILQPGDSTEFVFTSPGSFPYVCALHEQMSGEIVVE
jgi:plastocyanin